MVKLEGDKEIGDEINKIKSETAKPRAFGYLPASE
jgi:hypothetical protein